VSVVVDGEISNPYQSFISKSRYANWLEEENRRETWEETVDRYCSYMQDRMDRDYPGVYGKKFWNRARKAILNLEVMPSMRGLMSAGPALDRDDLAIFNCSFVAFDDVRAFDELIFILCCGTGAGFSVEEKYTTQLPVIASSFERVDNIVVVEDSKEGWANAYRVYLDYLYRGEIPALDITGVRPAGARLKTFGGRASGPQPFVDLIDFTIEKFTQAAGRRLKPIEVHDIACKIGDIVVSGGVRRSALISLSDINDYDMSKAKAGAWWESNPQRALSNNSAVYETKPSIGAFLQEWGSLYESKSGERGIFNKSQAHRGLNNRRDWSLAAGTNPCGEILLRSAGLCNLTEVVIREDDTLDSLLDKIEIATALGTVQSTFTNFRYIRPIWQENAEEERLLGVSLTGIYDNELTNGSHGKRALKNALNEMRLHSINVNKDLAGKMGINQSAAITCVKPSGTVSQLVDAASGIHPRHSEQYIRSVRGNNSDPLTEFLKQAGVPWEPDVMKPEHTTVFYFPVKSPEGAVTRDEVTAIEHLDLWLMYKKYWTEHNPSVTISVKESEWIEVANWVYDHWEDVGGLAFLPYSDHSYKQAPYQEVDASGFQQFLLEFPQPTRIEWEDLALFEHEDSTTGSSTLACSAGNCELVDISA
jgi:ribonucleoside-triphosphate reductase